jgi:uncharacterized membrane protein
MKDGSPGRDLPVSATTRPEHELEMLIGRILQIGVVIASAVVLLGGVLLLARQGAAIPDYRIFVGTEDALRHVASIFASAVAGDARAIVQAGIVLLIATPIMRVAFMLAAFAKQRDRLYVLLSAIVLAILVYGLAFAS